MKFYNKVEEFAHGTGTVTSRTNKIAKLISECEDEVLKTILLEYKQYLGARVDYLPDILVLKGTQWENIFYAHTSANIREGKQTVRAMYAYYRRVLLEYVNYVRSLNKPQWQILAERNGWGKL